MSDLPKQLRIKAGMINMGERIAWGSDSALMGQAADLIEQQQARIAELEVLIAAECVRNNELSATVEQLTRTSETLLAVLKRGDDPTAAMYQLEEVLSDAP